MNRNRWAAFFGTPFGWVPFLPDSIRAVDDDMPAEQDVFGFNLCDPEIFVCHVFLPFLAASGLPK